MIAILPCACTYCSLWVEGRSYSTNIQALFSRSTQFNSIQFYPFTSRLPSTPHLLFSSIPSCSCSCSSSYRNPPSSHHTVCYLRYKHTHAHASQAQVESNQPPRYHHMYCRCGYDCAGYAKCGGAFKADAMLFPCPALPCLVLSCLIICVSWNNDNWKQPRT